MNFDKLRYWILRKEIKIVSAKTKEAMKVRIKANPDIYYDPEREKYLFRGYGLDPRIEDIW